MATSIVAIVLPLWGMIGIWTDKIGWVTPPLILSKMVTLRITILEDITTGGSFGRTALCMDFSKRHTIHTRKR
jgi:hypothetical protein